MGHLPSREEIEATSKQIAQQFRRYTSGRAVAKARLANHELEAMTYEERRTLCEMVFSGKTAEGRRMGVWLSWNATGKKWRYQIDGHLIEARGPWSKEAFFFGAAPEQEALRTKASLPRRGSTSCWSGLRDRRRAGARQVHHSTGRY